MSTSENEKENLGFKQAMLKFHDFMEECKLGKNSTRRPHFTSLKGGKYWIPKRDMYTFLSLLYEQGAACSQFTVDNCLSLSPKMPMVEKVPLFMDIDLVFKKTTEHLTHQYALLFGEVANYVKE